MKRGLVWLPQCWRAAWLLVRLALVVNATLYASAEIQWTIIAGVPRPAIEIWARSAGAVETYPFDQELTRDAHTLQSELIGMQDRQVVVAKRWWRF